MGIKVKVKNANQVTYSISRYSERVQKGIKNEVQHTGLLIEGTAKKKCPVDTGRLRASINSRSEDKGFTAIIGTNVQYAKYVEFGTSRQRAQPYLYPAFKTEVPYFIRRLKEVVRDG